MRATLGPSQDCAVGVPDAVAYPVVPVAEIGDQLTGMRKSTNFIVLAVGHVTGVPTNQIEFGSDVEQWLPGAEEKARRVHHLY
jgi:hypothetical protein